MNINRTMTKSWFSKHLSPSLRKKRDSEEGLPIEKVCFRSNNIDWREGSEGRWRIKAHESEGLGHTHQLDLPSSHTNSWSQHFEKQVLRWSVRCWSKPRSLAKYMQQASSPSDAASSQVSQHEEMMKAPAALSRSCFLGQTSIRMDCWRTRDWKRINQFSVFVHIFCLLGWYRQISIDFKFGNEKFFFSTLFKWSSFVGARKSIRCSSATSCHPLFSQQIPKKRHRADDLAHERTAWPTSEASLHRLYYDYLSYRPHADDGDALLRRHSRRHTATLRQECHFDARQDRPLRSLYMVTGPHRASREAVLSDEDPPHAQRLVSIIHGTNDNVISPSRTAREAGGSADVCRTRMPRCKRAVEQLHTAMQGSGHNDIEMFHWLQYRMILR